MGTEIVLLHGFTHTGASWSAVAQALPERYRALVPDLRGHGAASGARPIGPAECVADVAARAPERFAVAGYSMGARVALLTALTHPVRVERLALVGVTPGIADPVEREARRESDEALAAEIGAEGIEAFAARWGRLPLFKGQPAAVAEAAHADRLRNDPAGLAAALRGLGPAAFEPMWGRLEELPMPVTLIVGERDAKFRKIAERMEARLRHAEVLVVPGAGHAVHLEAPRLVAAALEQPGGAG